MKQPVLEGPTVILRPLAISDAKGLAAAAAESREHYVYTRVPDGVEQAESYIAAALRDRDDGHRMPFVTLWRGQARRGCRTRPSARAATPRQSS